jgi:hypothetical protein
MFQALLSEHWFKDIKTQRILQTAPLYAPVACRVGRVMAGVR